MLYKERYNETRKACQTTAKEQKEKQKDTG